MFVTTSCAVSASLFADACGDGNSVMKEACCLTRRRLRLVCVAYSIEFTNYRKFSHSPSMGWCHTVYSWNTASGCLLRS